MISKGEPKFWRGCALVALLGPDNVVHDEDVVIVSIVVRVIEHTFGRLGEDPPRVKVRRVPVARITPLEYRDEIPRQAFCDLRPRMVIRRDRRLAAYARLAPQAPLDLTRAVAGRPEAPIGPGWIHLVRALRRRDPRKRIAPAQSPNNRGTKDQARRDSTAVPPTRTKTSSNAVFFDAREKQKKRKIPRTLKAKLCTTGFPRAIYPTIDGFSVSKKAIVKIFLAHATSSKFNRAAKAPALVL